jgi:hypothetical protein
MKLVGFLPLAIAIALASPIQAQPAKGTYNGLFLGTNGVSLENSGSFTLTTAGAAAFSGKLQIGNTRASLSGTFIGGVASVVAHPSKTESLTVQLQWDASSDQITGSVSDGVWLANLASCRASFDGKSLVAPQAGHYTIIIPGTNSSPSVPSADGYGTVTVTTAGRISLVGSLADGTKITQSTSLSTNGQWPLFISLYNGQGSIVSWVTFTNLAQTALSGNLNWIKPFNPAAKYYPAGFTNQTQLFGFAYQQPAKGNGVLDFSGGAVTLDGGNLAQSITNLVLLDANNRVNNLDANKLSMTITLPTGAFRGTVTDPLSLKSIPFGGVVVQSQNRGSGNFLGTDRSGQVRLGHAQGDLVEFQTVGSSFASQVSYDTSAADAFRWLWSDNSTSSSTNATKSFPGRASRPQLLTAFPGGVLTSINIGFDGSDGGETTPLNTNRPQQNVSSVYFPYPLTSLKYWASSYNPITNTLDFSGFTSLEAIECFHCTNLAAVVVSDLPSIKRLCFEACGLAQFDVSGNPNLEDLRAAVNTFTNIVIGNGTGPKIWHFCTRENRNITQRYQDIMTNFYSLREPWIWHDNQSGHLSFVSTNLTDVEVWGNDYTSADFTGQSKMFLLWAYENSFTNLTITGCTALQDFEAENNNLPSDVLNQIVIDLLSSPGLQFVNLTHQTVNSTPNAGFLTSPAALNAYTNLINQGVHIYVDWPPN